MKKILIGGLALSMVLAAESIAQTQSQKTTSGVTTKAANPKSQTSSSEGLQRTGSGDTRRGNGKMEGNTVSRSGNSFYSPTAPTSAIGSEYVIVAPSDNMPTRSAEASASTEREPRWVNQLPALGPRVRTQGSSSEGSSSVPTPGGAPGTNTKITVRQQPNRTTSTLSTSGQTGSQRPGSVEGVRSEAGEADNLTGPDQANTGNGGGQRSQTMTTSESGPGGASTSRVNVKPQGQQPGSVTDVNKVNQRPGDRGTQTNARAGGNTNQRISNTGQGTAKGSPASGSGNAKGPSGN
ncbi:hypothetical protein GCM10023189_07240 [Nibrella saemangeumensis]|uniref:Uncharacterized protein n=1 Tax=Nibrella saemangeumensis TaxID=1084526 RepID=A0ABP8MDB2_9BACT